MVWSSYHLITSRLKTSGSRAGLSKKKKNKNNHEGKRTAVPCREFCPLTSKEPRSKKELKTKRQQQQTAVTTLCSNHMRKSKHNLKPAGSLVNRGRLNCKKNDEKRKKRSRRPKLLIPTTLGYNLVLIINQNNAKIGFSQYSEWLLATQSSLPTNGVCGEGRA